MKLSEIKNHLVNMEALTFMLPNGTFVPQNFHVTEVGLITKNFIDCGGTVRKETVVNFQLWEDSNDEDHRLKPNKLLNIISLSEKVLGINDFEIEVEYQENTIGKYELGFNGENFLLLNKQTACLASEQCGIPAAKQKVTLSDRNNEPCCTPDGNCC
ncbi:hypothetical protein FNO01nite_17070 [Flavobacterium noncentrifugens]|uniref:Uncharacterized protein n=1 Tax=Flavobacterium noncentrifugens TaxID=1128970 RepID=A0A1G8WRQ1_9FLAO|nr:DUF6428 family protein [Flavobacterium noncentrifugens]GEP51035.1 hypothetical protein FNO01nite_17070 [Flavobacterium noncentrifugens]SDJ81059.1 hypothetical protein SAMN04487935_1932 [Flavobacterium noncentrifugens]